MAYEDEFSSAFSVAFDAPPDVCIDVDWSCIPEAEFAEYTPDQVAIAEMLAQASIRVLTGGQFGTCPITVRPCVIGCLSGNDFLASTGQPWMVPYMRDGRWYNACGCRNTIDCSCRSLTRIVLRGPVGKIHSVKVDGQVVDPAFYRLDNSRELVRLGGPEWPSCQDMSLSPNDVGTMSVTYTRGAVLDRLGQFVAGMLAKEYLNACTGRECRLPSYVESMARDGVTMDFSEGMFPGNRTGIDEVDVWVQSWNPYKVKAPAAVYSPDAMPMRSHR